MKAKGIDDTTVFKNIAKTSEILMQIFTPMLSHNLKVLTGQEIKSTPF
jgi:hypothetical protein